MEDLFELIVAVIVIIGAVTSSAKKQKKQQRPGAGQPAKQAKPKKRAAPVETLGDIEKKIDKWMRDVEQQAKSGSGTASASRPDMAPQRLEAEPMTALPLEEAGPCEGMSYTDAAGCIGGSLPHDANAHHQGMDFHPRGAHGLGSHQEDQPVAVERVKPLVSASELRNAVVWKEILDAPVSLRE